MYQAAHTRYDAMPYRPCGKSGLRLPSVSLGLWHNFGSGDSFDNMKAMCRTAFDAGITHFDLANNYGPVPGSAELNFGRLLKEDLAPYRDELVISTKAGYSMWPGPYGDFGSRKYLLASLDQSLRRLGLDYVDIFYHHRMDPNTPLEESMSALDHAVKSGKALYAGISNYDKQHTQQAIRILNDLHCPFVLNQVRYSIFDRTVEQNGLKRFAGEAGCGLIAYSPLAQGLLTGRYLDGVPQDSRIGKGGRFLQADSLTDQTLSKIKSLQQIAKERGQTLAQMALSWILKDNDFTSVLMGASKPEQILENLSAADHCSFSDEELAAIDRVVVG